MAQERHTRIVVHGALGKVGRVVVGAVDRADDLEPVGAVDIGATHDRLPLPHSGGSMPLSRDLDGLLQGVQADVVVDFTNAEGGLGTIRACARHGVNAVSGSTGWSDVMLEEARGLAEQAKIGALVAPNFALGAVLLIHLARLVGRYFDYADIFEAHHEAKIDSPSGTALAIARALSQDGQRFFQRPMPTKEPLAGARGGDFQGITVHSTRMPGRMAHHEVLLGVAGQTLSLRHDTLDREAFMPGVMLGIRHVLEQRGLTIGLQRVLGLEEG